MTKKKTKIVANRFDKFGLDDL